jgi:hypothetical protein
MTGIKIMRQAYASWKGWKAEETLLTQNLKRKYIDTKLDKRNFTSA